MKDKIKTWVCKNFIKDRYIIGIDYSNSSDYGCKVEGYVDKRGVKHITNVVYF